MQCLWHKQHTTISLASISFASFRTYCSVRCSANSQESAGVWGLQASYIYSYARYIMFVCVCVRVCVCAYKYHTEGPTKNMPKACRPATKIACHHGFSLVSLSLDKNINKYHYPSGTHTCEDFGLWCGVFVAVQSVLIAINHSRPLLVLMYINTGCNRPAVQSTSRMTISAVLLVSLLATLWLDCRADCNGGPNSTSYSRMLLSLSLICSLYFSLFDVPLLLCLSVYG